MTRPLVLEINTRCWLRALAGDCEKPFTLDQVPEPVVRDWKVLGFSHIWLMGVWSTGPKTLEIARAQPGLRKLSVEAFGENGPKRLVASAYAIADYSVAEPLGGAEALREFRSVLNRHGLQLMLDFVPNHLGVDHPWLEDRNELFVRSHEEKPGTFRAGGHWVAHGKDPHFPSWIDTAQLDYRSEATRQTMTEILQSIAAQCDSVRCDMAMLLLNDIFARTWTDFPAEAPAPSTEFWKQAIAKVRQQHPNFLFMAEAYWDTEPRLQKLGFDYCYDKRFLDEFIEQKFAALQKHLRTVATSFRPARFLTNHDEAPIASRLPAALQRSAAVLLLAQPGLCLLYDGQLAGRTHQAPVQFDAYWPEPEDAETVAFYRELIQRFSATLVGKGTPEFCHTGVDACFAIKWSDGTARQHLILTNLWWEKQSFPLPVPAGIVANTIYSDNCSSWRAHDDLNRLVGTPRRGVRGEAGFTRDHPIRQHIPTCEADVSKPCSHVILDIELVAGGYLVIELRPAAA